LFSPSALPFISLDFSLATSLSSRCHDFSIHCHLVSPLSKEIEEHSSKKERRNIYFFLFLPAITFFFNAFLLLHLGCYSAIVKEEKKKGHYQVIRLTLEREV
jgi:hypothetical protein